MIMNQSYAVHLSQKWTKGQSKGNKMEYNLFYYVIVFHTNMFHLPKKKKNLTIYSTLFTENKITYINEIRGSQAPF